MLSTVHHTPGLHVELCTDLTVRSWAVSREQPGLGMYLSACVPVRCPNLSCLSVSQLMRPLKHVVAAVAAFSLNAMVFCVCGLGNNA